jgi:hypothetical protein
MIFLTGTCLDAPCNRQGNRFHIAHPGDYLKSKTPTKQVESLSGMEHDIGMSSGCESGDTRKMPPLLSNA